MSTQLTLNARCKRCGSPLIFEQTDQSDLGVIEIQPCRDCIKNKVIKVLEAKEADFVKTYTEIKEEVLVSESK